ncbi:inactive protein RESTRICTED TEV MOVEMENT 2-like isoform X2 [Juglans microcarpa x Juglans regia]|nr:inactive protein RESTRICTED TEV MOVEMENT 2-like isoform X2 [Juglans microcarpa x Juglans regia]
MISGERKAHEEKIISFEKTFKVPKNTDMDKTTGKFIGDQVLFVTVPKQVVEEKRNVGFSEEICTKDLKDTNSENVVEMLKRNKGILMTAIEKGFKKDELKLQVTGSGDLIISGERKVHEEKIVYFEQTFKVPKNTEMDKTTGKFSGEILYVTVPKQVVEEKRTYENVEGNANGSQREDEKKSKGNANHLPQGKTGFKNDEIHFQITGSGNLMINGERKVHDDKIVYFEQTFTVPTNMDMDTTTGKFSGEILFVTVPKQVVDEKRNVGFSEEITEYLKNTNSENVVEMLKRNKGIFMTAIEKGFKKDELKLQVTGSGDLMISGERKVHEEKIVYFEQTFEVPKNTDMDKITGKFSAEILYVTVPKQGVEEKRTYENVEGNASGSQREDEKKSKGKVYHLPQGKIGFKNDEVQLQITGSGNLMISGERKVHEDKIDYIEQTFKVRKNTDMEKNIGKFSGDILFVTVPKQVVDEKRNVGFYEEIIKDLKNTNSENVVEMLIRNKGILMTAILAFSLGVLATRKL